MQRRTKRRSTAHHAEGRWVPAARLLLIACAGCFLFFGTGTTAEAAPSRQSPWRVVDGESLRWQGVHRQETSATCGPASVVTLLTYYMGMPVGEEEVARRARAGRGEDRSPLPGDDGVTMRGLQAALASWGVRAYGLAMTRQGLEAYLDEVGIPLIVRVARPEPHFTLVAGIADGHVLLADSALGWRALPYPDFLAMWDGIALAVDPDHSPLWQEMASSSNAEPLGPRWAGSQELGRMSARLHHLRRGVVGR